MCIHFLKHYVRIVLYWTRRLGFNSQ